MFCYAARLPVPRIHHLLFINKWGRRYSRAAHPTPPTHPPHPLQPLSVLTGCKKMHHSYIFFFCKFENDLFTVFNTWSSLSKFLPFHFPELQQETIPILSRAALPPKANWQDPLTTSETLVWCRAIERPQYVIFFTCLHNATPERGSEEQSHCSCRGEPTPKKCSWVVVISPHRSRAFAANTRLPGSIYYWKHNSQSFAVVHFFAK